MTDLLETLVAENAIRRLISSFCDAVIRKDAIALGQLFTEDAEVGIAGAPPRIGREAIAKGAAATFEKFTYLNQRCDAGLIDIMGDEARSKLNIFEASFPKEQEGLCLVFGIYEDRYKRTQDGWRFHRRSFRLHRRLMTPVSALEAYDVETATSWFAV